MDRTASGAPPPEGAEKKTFPYQGSFCAFAGWHSVLLTGDILVSQLDPSFFWKPLLALHAAASVVVFLATLLQQDIESIPLLRRLTPQMMSAQDAVIRRCPGAARSGLNIGFFLYMCVMVPTRIPTSGTPYLWMAVEILQLVILLPLLGGGCVGLCCRSSRRRAPPGGKKEQ
mmetsp:Transcript_57943/g.180063  ORF Transcript_57943/g.180063 Transcript_57943/m.180063 type:complete len:172 (-) Transcript_57943:148-663(-)